MRILMTIEGKLSQAIVHAQVPLEIRLREQRCCYPLWLCHYGIKAVVLIEKTGMDSETFGSLICYKINSVAGP